MQLDELHRVLREAAADQAPIEDRLAAVMAAGRHRRRRSRALLGGLGVAVLAGSVFAASLSGGGADVSTVDQPPSIRPIEAGTACPGSVTRRVDGGNPDPDALPPIEAASTDLAHAQRVLSAAGPRLLVMDGSTRVALGPGFGRAWNSEPGSAESTVVDTDDFGILVEVADAASCPTGGQLHDTVDGVPVFYFVRPNFLDGTPPTLDAEGRFETHLTAEVIDGGQVDVVFSSTPSISPGRDRSMVKWTTSASITRPISVWAGYAIEGLPASCNIEPWRRWESMATDIAQGSPPVYPAYNFVPGEFEAGGAAALDEIPDGCAGDFTLIVVTISESFATGMALDRVPITIEQP